ncbi:MAG: LacI family transcriptional regulator [Bacteroidales bacterium]|nr:LacI family transcriptional regulator [Bacteroidales bacterium]
MKDKKVTIYDVAALAGVSKGTVDRVVYNRGRVSEKTAATVRDAIEKLGYNPNLFASVLASGKKYVIACLLPKFTEGQYWEEIYNGFMQGAESVKSFNIVPVVELYDQYDELSFIAACDRVLGQNPSGVIFHPFFPSASSKFSAKLYEQHIPYGFVDGRIDDPHYIVYCGVDLYQSGLFGAFLLTDREKPDDVLIVRIRRDRQYKSDPTYNRRNGFLEYIGQKNPECTVHTIFVNPNSTEEINSTLSDFFSANPQVKHVIMLNSRVHLIADYMNAHPSPGRVVVGFDDLSDNVAALVDGAVDFLVTRRISMQSFNVVTALADYLLKGVKPHRRDNYMHIDVLTRYNLDRS